jgi:mono/diheme cytochrome c family protein
MRRTAARSIGVAVVGLFVVAVVAGTSLAQTDQPSEQTIAQGRVVFEANCVACHQTDGAGIPGVFPPLKGNDHVMDSDHVRTVLANGLTGEVVVNGTTYDSIMPPFAALSDEQVTQVIAYLQYGLNGTSSPTTTTAAGGASGGGGGAAWFLYGLSFVLIAGAIVLLIPSLRLRRQSGEAFGTLDVWAKTAVIVLFFIVFTVMIPSMIIKAGFLSSLPRLARDLLGTGAWAVFLGGGIYLLRRAQRSRVL